MAQQFRTQVEQMQAAAAHVDGVNKDVQGQLLALQNQLAPLGNAWTGQAAAAFQTLMERWNKDARDLNNALSEIGEQIRESGTTYQQADDTEHQSYSRISQALDH